MATKTLDRSLTLELGPVHEDLRVREARQAADLAVAAREATAAEARRLRGILASPPSPGDALSVLRARVGLPAAETAEVEAALHYEEAVALAAEAERQALAARVPAARERVAARLRAFWQIVDDALMPAALALRDQVEHEHAALGRPVFDRSLLHWSELLGVQGDGTGSLLELRRRQLRASGWLDEG